MFAFLFKHYCFFATLCIGSCFAQHEWSFEEHGEVGDEPESVKIFNRNGDNIVHTRRRPSRKRLGIGNHPNIPFIENAVIGAKAKNGAVGVRADFDSGLLSTCLVKFADSIVVNGVSGERRYGLTIEQCAMYCLTTANVTQGVSVCRSFVYGPTTYETTWCHLYINTGRQDPAYLWSYQHYDYFEVVPMCVPGQSIPASPVPLSQPPTASPTKAPRPITTPKPQLPPRTAAPPPAPARTPSVIPGPRPIPFQPGSPPSPFNGGARPPSRAVRPPAPLVQPDANMVSVRSLGTSCAKGMGPILQRVENREQFGADGFISDGVTEAQCVTACLTDTAPNGAPYECLSLDYLTGSQRCILTSEAAAPTRAGLLINNPTSTYYEKTCIPEDMIAQCPNRILERIPQMILETSTRKIETVPNYFTCILACFDSARLFGFQCRSFMYYYSRMNNPDNCHLNSGDHVSLPGNFIPETSEQVEYVAFTTC